ncbi:hypothetical protein GCM10017744_003630 [Streptomyces antimycoticus]|uniref:Uncharacterized protein n=1 Tax=Streptomyces antimycoticus TaxID=68175 RepID=A0A4D4KQ88_9ACTN|nr:hypothetical protein [Streptomyces antimycoticus]GDY48720.1 hypothetical protein SANT12839_096020 [Streptomyces antimycoticus]
MKPRTGAEASMGKPDRSWTGQITSAWDALHTAVQRRAQPDPASNPANASG